MAEADLCAIGVMAKTPEPGRSKTRLCPPLRPEQAAALSGAFLSDTTANVAAAALLAPIRGYAAYAPGGTEAILRHSLAPGTSLTLADGRISAPAGVQGFGRCLLHAMQGMFTFGHQAACVLSSDIPTLPTRLLVEAADILLASRREGRERVVLGASDDGGYYLLGATSAHAGLFTDIAWSTASVADATRERVRALGLELVELDPWNDIDDVASLVALVNDKGGYAAPRTRAVIEQLGLRAVLETIAA